MKSLHIKLNDKEEELLNAYKDKTGARISELLRKALFDYIISDADRRARAGVSLRDKAPTIYEKKQAKKEALYKSYVDECDKIETDNTGALIGTKTIRDSNGTICGEQTYNLTQIKLEIDAGTRNQ